MTDEEPLPEPLGTTVADRSLSIAMALSGEVIVLQERLEIIERLAAQHGLFDPRHIDAYRLSPQTAAASKARRLSFVERVFGGMRA